MTNRTMETSDVQALSERPTPADFGLTPADMSRVYRLTSGYDAPDWLFNAVAWLAGVAAFAYFISHGEQPFIAALMLAVVAGVAAATVVLWLTLLLGAAITALSRRIAPSERDATLVSSYKRYQEAHSAYETRLRELQVAEQRERSRQLRQAEEDRRRAEETARIEAVRGRKPDRETYAAYRKTAHWHRVRTDALARAGNRCQMCACTEHLQVHHNTYKNLGQEKPEDPVVVCDSCHETFHDL